MAAEKAVRSGVNRSSPPMRRLPKEQELTRLVLLVIVAALGKEKPDRLQGRLYRPMAA